MVKNAAGPNSSLRNVHSMPTEIIHNHVRL